MLPHQDRRRVRAVSQKAIVEKRGEGFNALKTG